MDPYDQTAGNYAAGARRQDVHDTIRDWRYQAAHKVAADEHYEQLIAEAAQSQLLAADGVGSGGWPLFSGMRQRLVEALVAVGTRLQGMHPPPGPRRQLPGVVRRPRPTGVGKHEWA